MAEPAGLTGLEGLADLDLDRTRRRGYPEAVYCAGKTPEQVGRIAAAVAGHPEVTTLFTRADADHAAADHEDVELLLPHPAQGFGTRGRAEG